MGDLRNSAEHYFISVSPDVIRAAVAESFLVIRDVVTQHLRLDPAELFSEKAWQVLLADSEVHAAEKAACEQALKAIDWGTEATAAAIAGLSCAKCGSTLFTPGPGETAAPRVNLVCRNCAESYDFDEITRIFCGDTLCSKVICPSRTAATNRWLIVPPATATPMS